jgi:transcriptional regulator with XRE-family HTH domain
MPLTAINLLRRNISDLLLRRKESQTSLAFALGRGKSWINKFLNGQREIQLKDLDRIADFFGIATYQLFQPGISHLTERRSGIERRSNRDRRISNATKLARELDAKIRPRLKDAHATTATIDTPLRALITEFEQRVSRLLSQAESGRQIATPRTRTAAKTSRHRTPSGSDDQDP